MTSLHKNFSQASENNKEPILTVLTEWLADCDAVLEIGSGTGQHALFFSEYLQPLVWYCSDLEINHPSINAWLDEAGHENFVRPIVLDVSCPAHWDSARQLCDPGFGGIFSANTAHIMSWEDVCCTFEGVSALLRPEGVFLLYGPFNREGEFTSPGNEAFDRHLRESSGDMGIRDDRDILELAQRCELVLVDDVSMPANNRTLVFKKRKAPK